MIPGSSRHPNPSAREVRPMPTLPRSKAALAAAFGLALALGARPAVAQTSVGGVVYAQWMYTLGERHPGEQTPTSPTSTTSTSPAPTSTSTARSPAASRAASPADIYRVADGSLAYRLKYAHVTVDAARAAR